MGADSQMIGDARLSAHHDAVADDGASGDADLRADHAMPAETDVVSDVDQVIEHATGTDHRIVRGTAVDGAVGADFDSVLDDNPAKLQHALKAGGAGHEAEALRSDRNARFDFDAPADQCVTNGRVGADLHSSPRQTPSARTTLLPTWHRSADLDVAPNDGSGVDLRPRRLSKQL